MDKTKNRLIVILGCLTIAYPAVLASDDVIRQWQSFTSFNEVTEMVVYGGDIWVATKGGLLRINPSTGAFKAYTNVNGLGTNQILALEVDDHNRLWIGGRGRLVDFTDPDHPDGYLLTDRDGGLVEVYDIAAVPGGDSLWLANRLGLTLFLTSLERGDGLFLDTYTRLGSLSRDIPARRVAIDSGFVWVGTDDGLAVGSRHDVRLLKAPTGWEVYLPSQLNGALHSDSVTALAVYHDSLYIGGPQGVSRFNPQPSPTLTRLDIYGDPLAYNLSLFGDSLLMHTARGSKLYYSGVIADLPVEGMPISNTTSAVFDDQGVLWIGNLVHGIFHYDGSPMIPYDAGGAPSNNCWSLVAAQGKIWGAFYNAGLAAYDGRRWQTIPEVEGLVRALAVGPLGELWVGTWGAGVYRVMGDSVAHYDTANSALSGIYGAPAFVVVTDIVSSGDVIWMANFYGVDGEVVAVNPYQTDEWQRFLLAGGISAELISSIAVGQGVVYAGSENNGIYAISYSETPFSTGDDYRWKFTSDNSGIGSDLVRSLKIDRFDTLWVGTAYGLSHQALGEIYFSNMTLPDSFGPEVTALGADGQGSLYAGSGRGMVVRDIATGAFAYLTSRNSGLVSDDIRDIYRDSSDNSLWIATSGGISRLRMPYALAENDVEKVLAYPNPFVILRGDETVRFNYAGSAQVRIFTLAGELVRDIPITGVWDGRNDRGETVASGVYIFTLTDTNGTVGRGKIFLVRK